MFFVSQLEAPPPLLPARRPCRHNSWTSPPNWSSRSSPTDPCAISAPAHKPPGGSTASSLSVLERWERAWHSLDLRQPALQCIVPRDFSVSTLRYEIHGGYLIGARRFPVDDRPLGYNYIDLHDAVKRGYPSWNNVDLHQSLSVFSYCFNVQEHNLAVMLV